MTRRAFWSLWLVAHAATGPTVPLPELSGLEDVVREQLASVHEETVRALSDPGLSADERGEAWGRLGRHYYAYSLTDAAETCFAVASRAVPGDYRWLYYRASLARESGDLEQAIALYGEALEARPGDVASLVYLADVLVEDGRPDEAEARLEQVLSQSPDAAVAMARLGELALARDRHAEAVEWLERSLERMPQANRLHYPLALAYRGLGDVERAREHLAARGRVGVAPPDPLMDELRALREGETVWLLRARRAFAAGDHAAALESFREAAAASPDSTAARVGIGAALDALNRPGEAESALREAVRLDPDSGAARYNLALVLARRGDDAGAIHHLRLLLARAPDDAEARFHLGRILGEAGLHDEAAAEFARLRAQRPDHEGALLGEGAALADSGRLAEALERLEGAHARRPESGPIAHALARLLAAGPDPERRDGARALDLALRVFEARSTPAHAETVALALAELGRCSEAAEWQRDALAAVREAEPGGARAEGMSGRLDRYEAGEPCRPNPE